MSAGPGTKRTSLHHGPNQPEQRCHELQITNGSIGNQALTPQSISGVALPFEKRPWAIGHMPLGTVELIRRLPRVQRRLAKSEEGQSRSTEPWPSCVASSQMARSPQPAWRKGRRLAVYLREHSTEPVLGSRSFHDAPASLRMGNAGVRCLWRHEGLYDPKRIVEERHACRTVSTVSRRRTMSVLRPVTPEEAKCVWVSIPNPSARRVAKALTQSGRRVHHSTIARWRAQDWRPVAG
jgi:hypothetical protein